MFTDRVEMLPITTLDVDTLVIVTVLAVTDPILTPAADTVSDPITGAFVVTTT